MTISESIVTWLNEYDGADFSEMSTDFIKSDIGSFAIFKSPQNVKKKYLDGSSTNMDFYNIFAQKSIVEEDERVDNQQFTDDLEDWVEERNINKDFPVLKDKCTCLEIGVNNSSAINSMEESKAIYQVTIKIKYYKEK